MLTARIFDLKGTDPSTQLLAASARAPRLPSISNSTRVRSDAYQEECRQILKEAKDTSDVSPDFCISAPYPLSDLINSAACVGLH